MGGVIEHAAYVGAIRGSAFRLFFIGGYDDVPPLLSSENMHEVPIGDGDHKYILFFQLSIFVVCYSPICDENVCKSSVNRLRGPPEEISNPSELSENFRGDRYNIDEHGSEVRNEK